MGSVLNHLMHPLTYRDSNGEIRYLSSKDVLRVKNYVLCLLALVVTRIILSSKSLKSNVLSVGVGTPTVFYLVTAILKMLNKVEKKDSSCPLRACDFASFGRAKRQVGLNALADVLAGEQDRREDQINLRQVKWTASSPIVDQERDDQL